MDQRVGEIVKLCQGGESSRARHDLLVRQTQEKLLKLKVGDKDGGWDWGQGQMWLEIHYLPPPLSHPLYLLLTSDFLFVFIKLG